MATNNGKGRGYLTANKQILSRTLIMMGMCGILTFVILAVRLYQLQIVDHDEYEQRAVEQQVRETTLTASRGTIYDANGTVLAISASVENVFISPNGIEAAGEDPKLIARGLSEILDVDYDAIMEKTKQTSSYYQTIKTKIEKDLADQVREFIKENKLTSVYIEPSTKRYYPYSSVASHIIGFVGTENSGLAGIESKYNTYLTGTNGRIVRMKSSAGTDMLFANYEDYYDAEDGSDVYLTIDVNIQQILESQLQQAVEDYDIQNGAAAIAMHPQTGEILGMVSLDNFDLNNYNVLDDETLEELENSDTTVQDELNRIWRNKGLNDTYEPGSTFKILTLAMALEESAVSESDSFYCGGSVSVKGRDGPVNCWKTSGHGSQTLQQAIQHSCNVALVNIAQRLGTEKFYDYLEAFGLFETTGIDLAGEADSIWWSRESFINPNSDSWAPASFGQTFKITPLQLVTAYSAIANGGYLMKPYTVEKVVASDGTVIVSNETTPVRQAVSEETSEKVLEILESVVGDNVEGTGKNAHVAGYRIGGKTGTSEKIDETDEEKKRERIVSFIGVAPIEDPQIVLLVILDTPSANSGIYISGGQMAAPTVGKMLKEILPYMGIAPSEGGGEDLNVQMPYVKNMTVEEAKSALIKEGYTVTVVGDGGKVTDQMPAAGAIVTKDTKVVIYAGESKSEETVTVPDLYNMTYSTAKAALERNGLYMKTAGAAGVSGTFVVSRQSLEAGATVSRGTVVEVTMVDTSDLGNY